LQRSHIVETEPFSDTFGPKAQRKRPRLDVASFEDLVKARLAAEEKAEEQDQTGDAVPVEQGRLFFLLSIVFPNFSIDGYEEVQFGTYHEPLYQKGTSRRIYGELYKVIDSSDVVLHIIDARDPIGTMCNSVLDYMRKEKAHKQVVLIINKCDLVPSWVTVRSIFSRLYSLRIIITSVLSFFRTTC
jgi:nuclear GTP-binding protein